MLSNEVLLRSKIAQLQLEKTKQQRKSRSKSKSKSAIASSEAGGQQPPTGAPSSSSSSSASATRGSGGRSGRPARKAPSAVSKHQLASHEAGEKASTPAADGVGGERAQAGGGLGSGLPDTEENVMQRFEAQVMRFCLF